MHSPKSPASGTPATCCLPSFHAVIHAVRDLRQGTWIWKLEGAWRSTKLPHPSLGWTVKCWQCRVINQCPLGKAHILYPTLFAHNVSSTGSEQAVKTRHTKFLQRHRSQQSMEASPLAPIYQWLQVGSFYSHSSPLWMGCILYLSGVSMGNILQWFLI